MKEEECIYAGRIVQTCVNAHGGMHILAVYFLATRRPDAHERILVTGLSDRMHVKELENQFKMLAERKGFVTVTNIENVSVVIALQDKSKKQEDEHQERPIKVWKENYVVRRKLERRIYTKTGLRTRRR